MLVEDLVLLLLHEAKPIRYTIENVIVLKYPFSIFIGWIWKQHIWLVALATCSFLFLITILLQPLIIVVEENETVLDDTPAKVGIEAVCIQIFSHYFSDFSPFLAVGTWEQLKQWKNFHGPCNTFKWTYSIVVAKNLNRLLFLKRWWNHVNSVSNY